MLEGASSVGSAPLRLRKIGRYRSLSSICAGVLLEDPKVTERPPEQDENQDCAQAAAAQLLGSPAGRDST
jgi:hypothetical protein